MDSDVTLWKCLATFFSILAMTVGGCTAHQNYLQAEVMQKSQNPAAVQCSFGDSNKQGSAFCLEVAKH